MKILIDIGHPAHVHLFKNFIFEMKRRKHKITVTCKDQRIVLHLLKKFKIDFINLGKKGKGFYGKFIKQFLFDIKVIKILYKKKVDIALGSSITISHACLFHKSSSYVFTEDDKKSAPLFAKFTFPFVNKIITPKSVNESYGKKHIKLNTLHELAYLHPNNFKANKEILKDLGIKKNEKYFILRFNAFKAHHDKGIRGLSLKVKRELIKILLPHGKVFINSEQKLEKEFEEYQIKITPEKMHDAIAFSSMFITDSNSMTVEAAVLGIPAIRCNDFVGRTPVIEELEHKYGLTYGFIPKDSQKMISKVKKLLNDNEFNRIFGMRKKEFLKDKIDLNEWMVSFFGKTKK
jgi:uncharacterized protein